jgi:hypothetical protein
MIKIKSAAALLAIAAMVAIVPDASHGEEASCARPVKTLGARPQDYRPVFQSCTSETGQRRLATRRMAADHETLLLTVDPETLATRIERAQCWRCADASDAGEAESRFIRALQPPPKEGATPKALENAGLVHGKGAGSFITGDLCPSRKALDRNFLESLAKEDPGTPIALTVSGLWIVHHGADWEWLKKRAESGALDITWVNHSYRHPYVKGRPDAQTYLLTPGVDMDKEIFDTEKLMIVSGVTPSVFFRFPGLVSDPALMETLRNRHLIALGADSWLALGLLPRPGSIVLLHPNGNEEIGLKLFSRLLAQGKIPKPFRPLDEAP